MVQSKCIDRCNLRGACTQDLLIVLRFEHALLFLFEASDDFMIWSPSLCTVLHGFHVI